jgi:hypothetical protein
MSIVEELRAELWNGTNPFDSADVQRYKDDGYPHTNLTHDMAEAVLDVCKPRFWLEIGSMLGGSIIRTVQVIKKLNMSTQICCIDPFCGDVNMWAWERKHTLNGYWRFLRLENGRPTIYDRFLANIKSMGYDDIIVPIVTTCTVGVKLLKRLHDEGRFHYTPDVIYLDSAHEPNETYMELHTSWGALKSGGILMGDDWSWDAVRNDVIRFSRDIATNKDVTAEIASRLPNAQIVDGILLYNGQWLLAKA